MTSVPPSQGRNELKGVVVSDHANHAPCPVTPRLMQEIEEQNQIVSLVCTPAPPAILDEKRQARINESAAQGAPIAAHQLCCKRPLAFFPKAAPAHQISGKSRLKLSLRPRKWGTRSRVQAIGPNAAPCRAGCPAPRACRLLPPILPQFAADLYVAFLRHLAHVRLRAGVEPVLVDTHLLHQRQETRIGAQGSRLWSEQTGP